MSAKIKQSNGAFEKQYAIQRTANREWYFDDGLAEAINTLSKPRQSWQKNQSIQRLLDAGAGIGQYVKVWDGSLGIDAIEGVEALSNHRVLELDLTKPELVRRLGQFHWVTCLEVAEHIPPEHTDQLLQNLTQLATEGIVCSWGTPGQVGHGHVNCRSAEDVRGSFRSYGWHESPIESERLKLESKLSWFRNNVMVFRPKLPKVFGIGLPKTGTASLNKALIELGYSSIHWPIDAITSHQLQVGDYRLEVLDQNDGLTDIQAASFFRELDQTWPGSRFLLTTRTPEKWLKSIAIHFEQRTSRFATGSFPLWLRTSMFGTPHYNESRFKWRMKQHNAEVKDWFQSTGREDVLLEIALTEQEETENWKQLSEFLGVASRSVSFPWENRKNSLQSTEDFPI